MVTNTLTSPRIDRKFVDGQGNLTPNAYALLYGVFVRTGGAIGVDAAETAQLIQEVIIESSATRSELVALRQSINEAEAIIADYRPTPIQVEPVPSGAAVFAGAVVLTIPSLKGGAFEHEESFAAPGVAAGMRVFLSLAPHSYADENNEQELSLTALTGEAAADSITARAAFSELTSGPIRINYLATP